MNEEKEQNVAISIIVPFYNMQKYLDRCLESILKQSFHDYEVVCVDDGSTDMSGEICEQYREKHDKIKVYHIANQGVSNARNYGLSRMKGKWFAFVDADDWIEPNYLSLLYENAIHNDCDVSACFFQRDNHYCVESDTSDFETIVFETSQQCIHSFICEDMSLEGMACNKLYCAEKFGDVCFDTRVKVNEDCLYTYEIMKRCSKACLCTAPLYHWFYREDSASNAKALSVDFKPADVFLELYHETIPMKDEALACTLKKNYIRAVLKVLIHGKYAKSDKEVRQAKKQCRQWRKDVWRLLDNRTKLKYILIMYMPWFFVLLRDKR